MGKFTDKFLGWLGFEVVEQEELVVNEEQAQSPTASRSKSSTNVVSIHNSRPSKVAVIKPETYEHAQSIADHLKGRRPVILNLEKAEQQIAKRILDFVSGTTYALGGTMQKVGTGIFLFVPSNMEVMGDLSEKYYRKNTFSWDSSSEEGQERG